MAKEKTIGTISHYYDQIGVGVIELTKGSLKVGENIHILGKKTDLTQTVNSLQVDKEDIKKAKKGKSAGLKVDGEVREGDVVYLVK